MGANESSLQVAIRSDHAAATAASRRPLNKAQGYQPPMSVSNGLLNETTLSAVSKLTLTRRIDMFRDRRVVPEDYPTLPRYARG